MASYVKPLFIAACLFSWPSFLHAQKLAWAKAYSSTSDGNHVVSVVAGPNDNFLIGGNFDTDLTLDGIQLTGRSSGFIARLDSGGIAQWAKSIAHAYLHEIETDRNGNVYAVLQFHEPLTIEGSTIPSKAINNGLLIKYSGTGELLWYKNFHGAYVFKVETDNAGNVYVLGDDFNNEPAAGRRTWVARFDPEGNEAFTRFITTLEDTGSFFGVDLALDIDDNIYISGLVYGEITLTGTQHFKPSNSAFVLLKLSSASTLAAWVRVVDYVQSGGSWYTSKVAVDGAGNICYYTFKDSMSLTKYDADGNILWTKKNERINIGILDMCFDEQGNLLASGTFTGTFTVDNVKFNGDTNQRGIFVASFDQAGICKWNLTGQNETDDYGFSMTRSAQTGALYIGGRLSSNNPRFGTTAFPGSIYRLRTILLKVTSPVKPVSLELGADRTICEGETIAVGASGFVKYQWSTGSRDPILNITAPGLYTLVAYDLAGNPHVDSVNVVRCIESIPNVITPNGDGLNDCFIIEQLDLEKKNALSIYDRLGKKVYETSAYQNNWTAAGLASGIYYYQLVSGMDGRLYKGWLHVMK